MKIKLAKSEKLYPLGTENLDGTQCLTTWIETKPMKWFYAIMVGDKFSRPYCDAPNNHKILTIFDDKTEARNFMMNNIQPDIYLSFGWIIEQIKDEENKWL